ncbi:zinc finger B-box domain-containing protein 1 [Rhinophrynus dorsalis]
MENIQLEIQNQEMEQKLNQLRHSMSREKEERELSNGYRWKSGQAGSLTQNRDIENVEKNCIGLSPEPEIQKSATRPANTMATGRPKIKGKACGQCETKSALLTCLECGEDYCPTCFAKFHQKGALKLHRTMPIQGKYQAGKLDVSHQLKREMISEETREKLATDKATSGSLESVVTSFPHQPHTVIGEVFKSRQSVPGSSSSLLHGTFNEDESAQSFNDALMEWRSGTCASQQKLCALERATDCTENTEAQTMLTVLTKPFQVKFKENGLSYMEKLMLKKHRRTPVNRSDSQQLDTCTNSLSSLSEYELNESNGLTAEEMEDHEHFKALFKPEERVKSNAVQEPALKIVELDKASEEDLEESRHFLVVETDNEIKNTERFPDLKTQKSAYSSAIISDTSPVQAVAKIRNTPLRSTYSIDRESTSNNTSVTFTEKPKDHLLKAIQMKDSESMEYKSSNDNQSLQTASLVNVPKEFKSIALRQKGRLSEYQGLKGFFTLNVDPEEIKLDHCPSEAQQPSIEDEKIICTGNSHWRPASSLSKYADDIVVQDIVSRAQTQYPKHVTELSFSSRQEQLTGSEMRRPYSAKSVRRTSESYSISRPISAVARPVSRAASEISEIESIDSTANDDPVQEAAEEQNMLAVLGKEWDALQSHPGNKESRQQANIHDSFRFTKHNKRLMDFVEKTQIKAISFTNSSPMHATDSVESRDEESDSDGDEETLQDRLNVLSLQ